MASTYHADIQALYVAYFNRPADYLGLNFWETAIENAVAAAGSDTAKQAAAKATVLAQISAGFAASDEYLDVYGDLPTEQVIGTVYQNLFGHAPDLAGLVFWVNAVNGGHMTIANAVTTIAAGAQGTDKESIENKVTAAVAFTNELDTGEEVLAYNGEEALLAAKQFIGGITTDASLAAAIEAAALKATVAAVVDAGTPDPVVIEHNLTASVNVINGTAGNDVFNGIIGGAAPTLTALDTLTGGAGENTLNIADVAAAGNTPIPAGVNVSGVQTLNVSSAGIANIDTTVAFTGLTQLNVLQATSAVIEVADGTAANVNTAGAADVTATDSAVVINAGGAVIVDGGSTQTVTAKGGVDLSGATGAIVVTDSAQGAANSIVTDGTSVTMSTKYTASVNTASKVTIGAVDAEPTGAVSLTTTVAGSSGATTPPTTAGDIAIRGGSTVSVTQNATQSVATTAVANGALTQSAVSVVGTAATTAVTIKQSAEVAAAPTVAAVVGKTESASIQFVSLLAGESLTVDGLKFTATAAMTAAKVAAAFANIAAGATHGSSLLGTYSGVNAGNFTSGAVSGTGADTVVYTSTAPNTNPTDIVVSDTIVAAVDLAPVTTQGQLAVTAKGTGGIIAGAVTINGAAIANVSLDSYASASITSDALTKLSLANAAGKGVTVVNTAATAMDLTLSKVSGAASTLDLGSVYTSLAIHSTGGTNDVNITAGGVTALTVDGDKAVDLSSAVMGKLQTVTVSGATGVTMDASGATVTNVNASATSGAMSVKIDASKASYSGGTGVDTVTVTGAVSKTIALGAGKDVVILADGTQTVAGSITGGADSDSLSMLVADADAASANALFASKVSGFEVLTLRGAAGTQSVDIDVLGGFNSVQTGGAAAAVALTMAGFTTGGTLTLTSAADATSSYIVTGEGFADGTADVFNIVVSAAAPIAAGSVTADDVESIRITSTDTDATGIGKSTLTVVGDSVKTITIDGNSGVELTSANATVTSINGSAMTGGLKYTTLAAVAQSVTGGAGNDILAAGAGTVAHTLVGGAGNDTLTTNKGMTTLTGGAGADTFVVEVASTNVNTYATITDATAGDKIDLVSGTGTLSFGASKLSLASTAVFQDYANAAVVGAATGGIVWFQYGGDTYIVQDLAGGASFTNNTDIVVKLTGMVDLSTTTLNDQGVLLIGAPGA